MAPMLLTTDPVPRPRQWSSTRVSGSGPAAARPPFSTKSPSPTRSAKPAADRLAGLARPSARSPLHRPDRGGAVRASPTPNVTTGYGTEPKALQTPGGPVAPGLGCQAPTSPPSRCAAGTPGRSRPGRGRPARLHRLAVRGVPPRVYALFRPWRREPSVSGSCALGRPCGPPPSRVPARPCGIPSAGGPPGYPGPGTRRCRSSPCPAPAGASLP